MFNVHAAGYARNQALATLSSKKVSIHKSIMQALRKSWTLSVQMHHAAHNDSGSIRL